MAYIPHIFLIRTLTNLHAGSGDTEYGIVDKLVQRDPVTNFPTIYASGIKGALREYFEKVVKTPLTTIEEIFGSDTGAAVPRQGDYRFLGADCLVLPKPEENIQTRAFERIYSLPHIDAFVEKARLLGSTVQTSTITSKLGLNSSNNPAVFQALAEKGALPVIARNHLDNGQSKNLWYEEVVPRETVFGSIVLVPDSAATLFRSAFQNNVHEKIIQIGGNATVGYGLCKFEKIA